MKTTRRTWLKRIAGTAAGCGLGVVVDTFWIEPFWLQIVERELPIRNLPSSWLGRTLVQLSDIHVGHQVSDPFLIGAFDRVAALSPDLVVVTGDFVTAQPNGDLPIDRAELIYRRLPRGRVATLGILGNHDYGPTWSNAAAADELVRMLQDCRLTILRNRRIDLDGLQVIGLDDLWAGRSDGETALANLSRHAARIVLCHNPDAVDQPIWAGYQGWILSGHTHGGQCKPPFLPPPLLPVKNRRYTAGEFDLFDGRWMYINRGLGHLLRVRFNARPEITVFRLMAA